MLGQAEGLFIRAVPQECSNQFLELYFETPKSGGEEGAVAEVKSCDCCPDRMVVIVFVDIAGKVKNVCFPTVRTCIIHVACVSHI